MQLACEDVKNGKLDCVIGDNLTIGFILNKMNGELVKVEGISYDSEQYGFAVVKGEDVYKRQILNRIKISAAKPMTVVSPLAMMEEVDFLTASTMACCTSMPVRRNSAKRCNRKME